VSIVSLVTMTSPLQDVIKGDQATQRIILYCHSPLYDCSTHVLFADVARSMSRDQLCPAIVPATNSGFAMAAANDPPISRLCT